MARPVLGRGLDALIGATRATAPPAAPPALPIALEVPLDAIEPNPDQPRRVFDQEEMKALAASIREHGVLQPVLVSRADGKYRLVAGERRVQAARLAGLAKIPAVVREDISHSSLELALVENLQRTDLNGIEQAYAYRSLLEHFGLTQEELARRLGRSQPTISNTLRLLNAPQELQDAVIDGRITEGHLRSLLPLPREQALIALRQVTENKLSVRQSEELARRLGRTPRRRRMTDPEVQRVQDELRRALGTKVQVVMGRRGGRISIDFYSNEEFERLYELLLRTRT